MSGSNMRALSSRSNLLRPSSVMGNDHRVDPGAHWTDSKTNLGGDFINCPPPHTLTLTGKSWVFGVLHICNVSDPVYNNLWMIWVVPFPQGGVLQISDNGYLWGRTRRITTLYLSWDCGVLPQAVLASTGWGVRNDQGTVTFHWGSWSQSSIHPLYPFCLGKPSDTFYCYPTLYSTPSDLALLKMVGHPSLSLHHGSWSSSPTLITLAAWLFIPTSETLWMWLSAGARPLLHQILPSPWTPGSLAPLSPTINLGL